MLINGGLIAMESWLDDVDALLEAFYPGQLGGDAIVNMLFAVDGKSPAGKLPFTNYRGDIVKRSKFRMDLRADGGITHRFFTGEANFPFGFGLGYTNFTFRMVAPREGAALARRTTARHHAAPSTHVVEVTNVGGRASQVVVLAFVCSDIPGAPLQSLIAFDRIALDAGESRQLPYTPSAHDLSTVDERGERSLRPGKYRLKIGDVVTPAETELELTGKALPLPKFSASRGRVSE